MRQLHTRRLQSLEHCDFRQQLLLQRAWRLHAVAAARRVSGTFVIVLVVIVIVIIANESGRLRFLVSVNAGELVVVRGHWQTKRAIDGRGGGGGSVRR